MLTKTLVLDDLFDPSKGWTFPPHQVPIERTAAYDGNPVYILKVDGYEVIAFEQTKRSEGVRSTISAMRVCFMVYSDLVVDNALAIAQATMGTSGLPAWGVDEDGDLAVTCALPFSEDFPLEFLRKQLVVAIGLAVEEVREAVAEAQEAEKGRPAARWAQACEVATVAGTFARAFFYL